VLCAAAERDSGDPQELTLLMRRQLPVITQRLQQTIDKFQRPQAETGRFVPAASWWESVQRAYYNRGIEFVSDEMNAEMPLPKELFDCVADNLLQNALRKRQMESGIAVRAVFQCKDVIEFEVCDTGAPVSADVSKGLLRGPVPSASGFGIGLYQAAQLADMSGFSLQLSENRQGAVRFTLRGAGRRS